MSLSLNTYEPSPVVKAIIKQAQKLSSQDIEIKDIKFHQLDEFTFAQHKYRDFEHTPVRCARMHDAKITMQNPDQIKLGAINKPAEDSWVCFLGDCLINDNVVIEEKVIIGHNVVISSGTRIKAGRSIPDNCIVNEEGIHPEPLVAQLFYLLNNNLE